MKERKKERKGTETKNNFTKKLIIKTSKKNRDRKSEIAK